MDSSDSRGDAAPARERKPEEAEGIAWPVKQVQVLKEVFNGAQKTHNVAQKRKWDDCHEEDGLDLEGAFTIQPGPSSSIAAVALTPRMFVAREQLPLFFVDTSAAGHADVSKFFKGHIQAFEARKEVIGTQNSGVLIAQDVKNGVLFALEVVRGQTYAMCPLQKWVSVEDFERNPTKAVKRTEEKKGEGDDEPWWKPMRVKRHELEIKGQERIKMKSQFRLALKPPPPGTSTMKDMQAEEGAAVSASSGPAKTPAFKTYTPVQVIPSQPTITTVEDLSNMIRTQYLEALYISRTSLAYFAKGPLSRARAVLQSSELKISQVIGSLRSSVLTLSMMNKKYSDAVTEVVEKFPAGLTPDDLEAGLDTATATRIRKSKDRKKTKNNGLCIGEEEYVLRWWVNRETSQEGIAGEGDTRESRLKKALPEQRARETQLQTILILEVFALEAQAAKEEEESTAGTREDVHPLTPAKQPSKKHNLNNILDTFLDRLCIWESMNVEGTKIIDSDPSKSSSDPGSGRLQDFCTEVVVPFYSTRLPELYITICQKLGASILSSPQATMQTPAAKKRAKPGAPVTRPGAPKLAKSKSNLTTTSSSRRPLSRSATDSLLTKRELTPAIDLADIPKHRGPLPTATQRYEKREVDLAAVTSATEAKLARKAKQEKEQEQIRGAIAGMRRPANARAIVKDYADDRDRRIALAGRTGTTGKKPRKSQPVRNPFAADGIQVEATPRGRRMGAPHLFAENYAHSQFPPHTHGFSQAVGSYQHHLTQPNLEVVPPSDGPVVPSSSLKPLSKLRSDHVQDDGSDRSGLVGLTPSKPAVAQTRLFAPSRRDAIESTPSRRRDGPGKQRSNLAMGESGNTIAAVEEDEEEPDLPPMKIPAGGNRLARGLSAGAGAGMQAVISTPSKRKRTAFVVDTPSKTMTSVAGPGTGRLQGVGENISAPGRQVDDNPLPAAENEVNEAGKNSDLSKGDGSGGKEQEQEENGEDVDIYAALGWNDDYDL